MWLLEVELIASTSSEDIADASVLVKKPCTYCNGNKGWSEEHKGWQTPSLGWCIHNLRLLGMSKALKAPQCPLSSMFLCVFLLRLGVT
jgi:hypothetical protein